MGLKTLIAAFGAAFLALSAAACATTGSQTADSTPREDEEPVRGGMY